MSFVVSLFTTVCITVVGVTGVFLITGLTGMFSLGQASFMAIGAYAAGVLAVTKGVPFPLAAAAGVALAALAAFIVGIPTIRLRRDYIALVTFGFGEAIIAILNNTVQITGGAMGLMGIPMYTTAPLAFVSAVVCVALAWNFKRSRFGRQCLALKSDELAARAMGIDVDRLKMTAFVLSAAVTGYAGVLYAFYTSYVEPNNFNWTKSAEWIIMVFFGGIGSLSGAVLSALVLGALPEVLRFAAAWRIVAYCVIVLAVINYRPSGIFGESELDDLRMHLIARRKRKGGVS
jgi:branched-chain amino acid transport system permease protein